MRTPPDETSTMEPSGRRDRNRIHTSRRLYEAAMQLFEEQGYDETTMDEIADLADTARQTVYNYFPRKSSFIDEWAARRRSLAVAGLEKPETSNRPIAEQISLFIRNLVHINLQTKQLTHVLIPAWVRAGGPIDDAPALSDLIVDFVKLGQQRGELDPTRDPTRASNLIREAYLGALYQWVSTGSGENFDLSEAVDDSLQIIFHGLTKPHADSDGGVTGKVAQTGSRSSAGS